MVLPTFLGIGVQRSGTTWLHTLLDSHPEVYVPSQRKEVCFFNRYYERGPDWYSTYFCPPEEAHQYRAIGEICTEYYECSDCPVHIFKALPGVKLMIMLRHPVSRAYSHYGFVVQRRNYRGSFRDFLVDRPKALEKGYYSRYLKQYLRHFDRSQILALLFEDVFADIPKAKKNIADFLNIDVDKFPETAGSGKVNESSVPSRQSLYGFVVKTGRRLRRWHLEPFVDFVMRLGIHRVMSKGDALQPLDKELKKELTQLYLEEFDELEKCMQIDLSSWRK
jgi:Sulfotransferase domain